MISSFFEKINTPVKPLTYDRPSSQQMLTGELLEKHGKEISVLVSETRIVKAVVKEPIQAQVGEKVAIDRRQIEHMETKERSAGETGNATGKPAGSHPSDAMLQRLQVPVTEEARMALENLEKHGMEMTRSNVMALMTAKGLLDQVIGTMSHEKAVQLLGKNIDVDRTSLQDLARLLQESPEAKEKFSFLKFLGLKKDMSTADAEKTAQKLYGQKMGKDVADAIKALDKQGLEITKQQVDLLLSVQVKLRTLQGVKEETLLETLKGKIAPTLENLYKLHQGMEKGRIEADPFLAPKSTTYGQAVATPAQLTEKDLKAMEGDIARQIQEEGLEATPERIRMAGVFLKNGVAVTGETLQRMEALKEAVQLVTEKLDANMISALQKAGIAVDKQDITQLAQWIREHEGENNQNIQEPSQVSKEALNATMKQLQQQLANLDQLDEKQLVRLIRQGGELRLEQLAPVAERITLTGLSETDQQALRLAQTLGRLSDMSLDTAALHLRREAPLTLEQLVNTQQMLTSQSSGNEEVPPPQPETAVNRAVEMYLAQRGLSSVEAQAHKNLEALQALSRQQVQLSENKVSQLYAIRGAIENLQQMTLAEARQLVEELPKDQSLLQQPLLMATEAATAEGFNLGFQKLELLEVLRQVTPEILAFHMKHQLPQTPEVLRLTMQLFNQQISMEDFKTSLAPLTGQDKMPTMQLPQEMDSRMELVLNRHLADLFPHTSADSETGEQLKELARVLMEQQMPVNREHLQQLMQATRQMEDLVARLPRQEMSLSTNIMQQSLQELAQSLQKTGMTAGEPVADRSHSLARLAESMATLQSLSGEEDRKESILSLLIKNAVPVSLEEVRHMNLFLQNKEQTGQLLGQMIDLLKAQSDKADHPTRQAAEQLVRLMEEATQQLKNGKGPSQELYKETAKILKELEPTLQQLSSSARESLSQTGEKLLNSLELQSQLNREDTVYQLPFMMNGQMQNLQLYFMNQKKNKKIDPNDMTVLLNFDTQHMGNLNVFVGVKYKKIVMKIGVQKEEDKEWLDAHRQQLEEVLEAMDYEIKDLAYRVEEAQHLMTLADEVSEFKGLRRGQLDLRI